MRVAFHSMFRMGIDNMHRSLGRMAELQQRIATARNFSLPSEDPLGAEKSVVLNKNLAALSQLRSSGEAAMTYLRATEGNLLELNDIIRQAKTIAISQRDGTADPNSRMASAAELMGIRDEVAQILNHQVNGRYLFSGHRTDTKPFVELNGAMQYMGDGGEIAIRIGYNETEVTNVPGSDFMGFGPPALNSSVILQPRVSGATLVSALNLGSGVAPDSFEIEDESGNILSIDMSTVSTVQDLLDQINAAALDVTASIGATGGGIELVATNPGGAIHVREVAGGSAAADLGILGDSIGTLTGGNLHPSLTTDTPLSDVPQIALPLGAIRVYEDGSPVIVDFASPPPAATIGELVSRFNQSVSGLVMTLNAAGNGFEVTGAADFSIEAVGADSTAVQLGLVGSGQSAQLFGSLERLHQALLDNDEDGIENAIAEIDGVLDGLQGIEGIIGARLQRVDFGINLLERRELEASAQLSAVVDLDMAEAISQYAEAQTLYQAALGTATSLANLNLLNYL